MSNSFDVMLLNVPKREKSIKAKVKKVAAKVDPLPPHRATEAELYQAKLAWMWMREHCSWNDNRPRAIQWWMTR